MRMAERPSADAIACTHSPVQAPTLVTYPARRPRESTLCATRAMSAPGMTVSTPATTAKATSCRSSHVPKSTAVSIRSAPLLLEVARLVGRRGQGVARARLLDERILDLLLREAVPLVVPGRLHVRPALGLRVLLAPHLEVPAGVLVDLDHLRIAVERHEGVADAVLPVPVLGRVIGSGLVLATHVVDEAPRAVLHLGLGVQAVEARPTHRALAHVGQAREPGRRNVAGALAELRIVRARQHVADVRGEHALAVDEDVARLSLVQLEPLGVEDLPVVDGLDQPLEDAERGLVLVRIEGSQLFVEELAAGCEDHRPELAEAVHVRLESLEDRIVGQARLLDGERRLLELLERDRRFVDAGLLRELPVVHVDVDVPVIGRAVLLALVCERLPVEREDVAVELGKSQETVDRLNPAGLDPGPEVDVADVVRVRLGPGVEQGDHLLVVELEVERRVLHLDVRVLLHEALDVGLDNLGLERPAREAHDGLGAGRAGSGGGGQAERASSNEAAARDREGHGRLLSRRAHPLTAPETSPWTMSRWKRNARTSGGTTARTPPAAMSVRSVVTSVAKPATTTGTVLAAMLEVRITANR